MSKGFIWLCQNNNDTDYARLSVNLAKSLKEHNKESNVCVITDHKTHIKSKHIDVVLKLENDDSEYHEVKWANEHKVFRMSPFTHSIKLAADMIWTSNTDWWWNFLWKHNMVFSIDCFNYKNQLVKKQHYRPFHNVNRLQNIYSDLTYFRKSRESIEFGEICKTLTHKWDYVKENLLVSCHDRYPSTDVVYALAQRIIDPFAEKIIDYPWFKIMHNKKHINNLGNTLHHSDYLMSVKCEGKIFMAGYVQNRPLHYVDKRFLEELNARIF